MYFEKIVLGTTLARNLIRGKALDEQPAAVASHRARAEVSSRRGELRKQLSVLGLAGLNNRSLFTHRLEVQDRGSGPFGVW